MLTETKQITSIEDIRRNIHNISFIIGAGFSKNISPLYSSWKELLHDMIVEMYEEDRQVWHATDDEIIDKYGYLGIASEYVRRKGYHEAIDNYIEKHTPVLTSNDHGGYDLDLDGKTVQRDVDTSLHTSLLQLKPKNIYTFNYDNAFECHKDFVDEPNHRAIEEKKNELTAIKNIQKDHHEIASNVRQSLKNLLSDLANQSYYDDFQKIIAEYNEKVVVPASAYMSLSSLTSDAKSSELLSTNNQELGEKIVELTKAITELDNGEDHYLLIRQGGEISLTDKRGIYKLHGSLRDYDKISHNFKGKYGFDTDHHTQYIISQEDYDSYSTKHEPFVDLMRISLLKDQFCIIGFSCDDPNFLLWINWVKDVYDHAEGEKNIGKKYFINVGFPLSEDKQLLLETHNIDILDLSAIFPNEKGPKKQLQCFFNYLIDGQDQNKEINQLWDETYVRPAIYKNKEPQYNRDLVNKIWEALKTQPLFFMDKAFMFTRDNLAEEAAQYLKKNVDNNINKLFFLATIKNNVPFSAYINSDEFINKITDETVKMRFVAESEFQSLLENGHCKLEIISKALRPQTQMLMTLYNFEIVKEKDILSKWEPENRFQRVLKDFVFSSEGDKTILVDYQEYLKDENYVNNQEQLTTLQILNICLWDFHYGSEFQTVSKSIIAKINKLKENQDLVDIFQYFDDINKHIDKKQDVKPLGDSSQTIYFSHYDGSVVSAIKLINFIARLGISPRIGNVSIINKELWLAVAKNAYIYYPIACYYYSTTFHEKKLNERISQLYAYNPLLCSNDTVERLLITTLKGMLLYAERLNAETLATYANRFIKVVRPERWSGLFIQVWDRYRIFELTDDDKQLHDALYAFVRNALNYTCDEDFRINALIKLLQKGESLTPTDNDFVIACINRLDPKDKKIRAKVSKLVFNLTRQVPTLSLALVIFNCRKFLSSEAFKKWLYNVSEEIINTPSLLPAFANLAAHRKELRNKLFKLISTNTSLWNTGVNLDANGNLESVSSGGRTLYIESIEEHLTLPTNVAKAVYIILKDKLHEIGIVVEKNKNFNEFLEYWGVVLVSMDCFLIRHKETLKYEIDYENSIGLCKKYYVQICGCNSVLEQLTSKESYQASYALLELDILIHTEGIKAHVIEIEYILFHVADMSFAHLRSGFELLSLWLKKSPGIFKKEEIHQGLQLVLSNYLPYFESGNDKELKEWTIDAPKEIVERELLKLNKLYQSQYSDLTLWNDYIPQFWINEQYK